MTNEEALNYLRDRYEKHLFNTEENPAIAKAIESLNKQVPKKPVLTFKSNEYLSVRSHCCTVCKSSIIENQKFCDECGQKLDWGSVNDTVSM